MSRAQVIFTFTKNRRLSALMQQTNRCGDNIIFSLSVAGVNAFQTSVWDSNFSWLGKKGGDGYFLETCLKKEVGLCVVVERRNQSLTGFFRSAKNIHSLFKAHCKHVISNLILLSYFSMRFTFLYYFHLVG